MKVEDLSWEYLPLENPDWDYARNQFTVLKRPQATWSQSVFSVRHENLIAPNRDYSFQGLCAFAGNEYFKFLDAVFFGIKGVSLEPKKVTVTPWKHTYHYSGGDVDVSVSYFLCRDNLQGALAKVVFDVKTHSARELILKPLVDIRNACCQSRPDGITSKAGKDCITATSCGNSISFFVDESSTISRKEVSDWKYKLGSGFRENTDQGVKFVPEYGSPVFAGEIHKTISKSGKITLLISCNRDISDFDENEERSHVNRIAKKFDCGKETLARIISMDSFGIFEDGLSIPDAGDFWFRQIWLRDLLESMINNFNVLSKIGDKRIEGLMCWILERQDKKTGLFANFKGNYDSIDASLLFFLLAEKYMKSFKNKEMEKKIGESYDLFFRRLLFNSKNSLPEVRNNLLYCLPQFSWVDSMLNIKGRNVPSRVPSDWNCDGKLSLLPEVNAMFIRFLKFGQSISRDTSGLYKNAIENYEIFMNGGYLYSVIVDDKKDQTESSMALVSAVLLYEHVFSREDLVRMWPSVERLLVKRNGKLFGMLCRDMKDRTYLNDNQYHGSVVWPRDTPYLIRYLQIIGKDELVKEILESNLDHQMKECAIFYSNELFSLPEGRNPSQTNDNSKPVPMKNPIQLWSNFCDAYIM